MTLWKQYRRSGVWIPDDKPPFGWELDREHPLVKPMTGCWPLNEGGGPNAFNWLNGDDNPLIGCTWAQGGVLCDGDYERIAIASAVDYLGSQGSVAFKYRKTVTPSEYYYWYTVGDAYTIFSLYADLTPTWVRFGINTTTAIFTSWGNLFDGKSHSVLLTWDDATDKRELYVDGVLEDDDTTSFTWPALTTEAFNLGARADSTARYAGGVFNYFHIFNKVLTAQEVRWLHHKPWSMFKPKPVAKYFYIPTGEAAAEFFYGTVMG